MNRIQRLQKTIQDNLPSITHIELEDESGGHSRGLETHYRLIVVSEFFAGQSRVIRQRKVMTLFADEFENGLHSVSMRLMTPEEWSSQNSKLNTPACGGGDKL